MPLQIRKRGSKFCVEEPSGKSYGCHTSRAAAERQRRAINISKARRRSEGMWLIADHVRVKLENVAHLEPTALQRAMVAQRSTAPVVRDSVMHIDVVGVLTKEPDIFAAVFGGGNTTYPEIIRSLAEASLDDRISSVQLNIDSPGGVVDGLFETLDVLKAFEKPINVLASNALSAAYAIAASAGPITARTAAAQFGSIGVARAIQMADNVVTLTNSESPDKRPDVTTEEGRDVVVKHLDSVFELFVDSIAQGRSVSGESVKQNYGRGATLVASDAKRLGMIDGIAKTVLRSVPQQTNATASVGAEGKANMDLTQLRAEHPALFAEAVQIGVSQERDRVEAHLYMAEQTGDTKIAFAAIRDGEGMTAKLQAKYMGALVARTEQGNRQTEDDAVGEAVDGVDNGQQLPDLGMQVAAATEAILGKARRHEEV